MESPARFVSADVSDMKAVVIGIGEFESAKSRPRSFVAFDFSDSDEIFNFRRSVNDGLNGIMSGKLTFDASKNAFVFDGAVVDLLLRNENVPAIRAGTRGDENDLATNRTSLDDGRLVFTFRFRWIRIKRPSTLGVRKPEAGTILNVVDNDGDFFGIVGIGAQGTHGLLNVERQGFSGTSEDNGVAVRDVEALREKLSIAENFDIACAEIVNEFLTNKARSIAVDVSGRNASVAKILSDVNGMLDVDAVADSGFSVGEFNVIVDYIADDFFVIHDVFDVGIDEFAEFGTDMA